jgi:ATP-binding cassette subfamily C protein
MNRHPMLNREMHPEDRLGWGLILQIVQGHRSRIALGQVLAILAAITAVPVPLLLPLLVDEVLLGHPGTAVKVLDDIGHEVFQGPVYYITALLLLTVLLRFLTAAFNVAQTREFSFISKDVVFALRKRLLGRLERISMAEYESLGSGAVVTHLVADLDTLDNFIGVTVGRSLVALLTLIGTGGVLLWMNWQLGLFILLLNPLVIFLTRILGQWVKRLKRRETAALSEFQTRLTETLEAIHQIRASNRESFYFGRLQGAASEVRDHSAAFLWKSDAASRLSFLVFLTGFDLFRGLALLMVVYSDLTIGQMMAVSGYLWFMMAPVQEVLGMQYAYFGARAALERLHQFYGRQLEPLYPHRQNPFIGKTTVGISIQGLSFVYPGGEDVLRNVSLEISAGEKVALVGASGGGKSTLVQALIGLYPPASGVIAFDGVPTEAIGLDVVRENVVTVLQHPVLFNDTVRSNLAMGREASDADLWHALEVAQLKSAIAANPLGLDAVVGRLGVRLSGGQRQRLAIARMVLANPRVVILDEATSAVDNVTEGHLYAALDQFLAGRTTLIVAHRLSAITHADRILVFEEGHVVEEGSHEALMGQGGLYARLVGAAGRKSSTSEKALA